MRVLFTGGRSPATLALLRLFAQAGHHCEVAESLQPNLAGASRYCSARHHIAPPRQQTERFVSELQQIIQAQRIDLLIPTCEESFYVSRYRRELESSGCQVFCATIDVLTNLHSKYQFNQLIRALGLPAPATECISNSQQLEARLTEWGPFVLKPEFSRFASQVLINQPLEEVRARVKPSAEQPWVLQEFLDGPQFCSYSVALNGRLQAHGVYPTTYAMGSGATIYFESIDAPAIERMVTTLVRSLDYTGQISFDFIFANQHFYPIECNPRTTTGTFLFGPNDRLDRAFLSDGPLIRPRTARPQVLTLPMLLYALPAQPGKARQLFKDIFRASDPLMQLDDISPFFAQFGLLWQTLRQARRQHTSLMVASTHDIEWNGQWDMRTRFAPDVRSMDTMGDADRSRSELPDVRSMDEDED